MLAVIGNAAAHGKRDKRPIVTVHAGNNVYRFAMAEHSHLCGTLAARGFQRRRRGLPATRARGGWLTRPSGRTTPTAPLRARYAPRAAALLGLFLEAARGFLRRRRGLPATRARGDTAPLRARYAPRAAALFGLFFAGSCRRLGLQQSHHAFAPAASWPCSDRPRLTLQTSFSPCPCNPPRLL